MEKTNNRLHKSSKKESDTIDDVLMIQAPVQFYDFSYMLANTIRETRIRLGITQDELSKRSNVNRTTIAKLESHQRLLVNIKVINRLLDSMDLELCIINKKGQG